MYACICSSNHKPSRVENFGVPSVGLGCNFFDPSVPPSTQQHFKARNNSTVAINPQDIILNKDSRTTYHPNAADNQMEDYLFKNVIDPTGYYMETEQPFYLSFSDTRLNDPPSLDLMFSVGCPEETFSSSSSICSIPTRRSSSTIDPLVPEEELISLPPSVAILQSELNRSSLDYFIANNSFLEEIRSSISSEQQQYINSGMANTTPSQDGVTTPSTTAYDLISSTDCTNIYSHQTAYDDIFEDEESQDKYDHPSNENINEAEITETLVDKEDEYYSSKEYETRTTLLLQRLKHFNYKNNDYDPSTFQEIKREYDSEINHVFEYKDLLSDTQIFKKNSEQSRKLAKLYSSIFKAYGKANLKVENTKGMNKEGSTNVRVNGKRKNCDTEKRTQNKRIRYSIQENYEKKSRKNYGPDVVNALMDWYLNNDGRTPTNKEKQTLAEITGKSTIQISTWFQNAKRRYQEKLDLYQSLSSKYPKAVYDARSFKLYLRENKNY